MAEREASETPQNWTEVVANDCLDGAKEILTEYGITGARMVLLLDLTQAEGLPPSIKERKEVNSCCAATLMPEDDVQMLLTILLLHTKEVAKALGVTMAIAPLGGDG